MRCRVFTERWGCWWVAQPPPPLPPSPPPGQRFVMSGTRLSCPLSLSLSLYRSPINRRPRAGSVIWLTCAFWCWRFASARWTVKGTERGGGKGGRGRIIFCSLLLLHQASCQCGGRCVDWQWSVPYSYSSDQLYYYYYYYLYSTPTPPAFPSPVPSGDCFDASAAAAAGHIKRCISMCVCVCLCTSGSETWGGGDCAGEQHVPSLDTGTCRFANPIFLVPFRQHLHSTHYTGVLSVNKKITADQQIHKRYLLIELRRVVSLAKLNLATVGGSVDWSNVRSLGRIICTKKI